MEKTHQTSDMSSDLSQSSRADRPTVLALSAEGYLLQRRLRKIQKVQKLIVKEQKRKRFKSEGCEGAR